MSAEISPLILSQRPRAVPGFVAMPYGEAAGAKTRYLLKDVSLTHYVMTSKAGLRILELVDGERSLADILSLLAQRWQIQLSPERLCRFLDLCARNEIVDASSWQPVFEAAGKAKAAKRRYLGIDPLLALADDYRAWWLNPVSKILAWGLVLLGAVQLFHIPPGGGLLAPLHLLSYTPLDVLFALLPLVFCLEVFLHELAHALACHHFGARSRGFAFTLVLGVFPSIVTDTAEANTLRNKYQRMMVSFAGPMVNLIFFGLAMSLYQSLDSGSFAARLVLAYSGLSLSCIVINLHPFLIHMDGYWIVADWCEQPNLRRLALAELGRGLRRMLGLRPAPQPGLRAAAPLSRKQVLGYGLYAVIALVWTTVMVLRFGYELGQAAHLVVAQNGGAVLGALA